jgi:hypothetical protein
MITFEEYQKLALSFPDTMEVPHFDNPSFRFRNKIFGTYWKKDNKAMLKLSLVDQSVFCAYDKEIFYPVDGYWGKQGATFITLSKVRKDMFKDAITCAYKEISKPAVTKKKPKK